MVKKLLNPLYFCAFIALLVLVPLGHLMYGSCQTSKWHYIFQEYKMPDKLPNWLLFKNKPSYKLFDRLYDDYNGKWESWYQSGNKKYVGYFVHGQANGLMETWYENGVKKYQCLWSMGKIVGKVSVWYESGEKKSELTDSHIENHFIEWNKDGTLNKKEYYDTKGNVIKTELFKDNKLTKTETTE